jgi:hypothetical protein
LSPSVAHTLVFGVWILSGDGEIPVATSANGR